MVAFLASLRSLGYLLLLNALISGIPKREHVMDPRDPKLGIPQMDTLGAHDFPFRGVLGAYGYGDGNSRDFERDHKRFQAGNSRHPENP